MNAASRLRSGRGTGPSISGSGALGADPSRISGTVTIANAPLARNAGRKSPAGARLRNAAAASARMRVPAPAAGRAMSSVVRRHHRRPSPQRAPSARDLRDALVAQHLLGGLATSPVCAHGP
jgi:hypothetical protein